MLLEKRVLALVTVKYYILFFVAANYCPEESYQLVETGSLGELVELVCQKHGEEFRRKIFHPDGSVKTTAWFILNGKRIEVENILSVPLQNGDQIIISSPLLVGG